MSVNADVSVDPKTKKMTIVVDLAQRHGLSGTGATLTIASTQGGQKVGLGDITMNLSVYTKEGLEEAQLKTAKERGYKNWVEYRQVLKGKPATGG